MDERKLTRFLDVNSDAEYELDLRGLDLPHSVASIDRMVERQRFRDDARSVRIGLEPASAGSGETLFGPIGRHLVELMKKGLVAKTRPIANIDGGGFRVELPAGKAPREETASDPEPVGSEPED
ncbi:hypothetical protein [Denitrobaculum tricleocarpae]|uniref:Uncharacterized protein n=1 Tax=Denitrobaculum tricleocarpae TaxID=2591009 RepID=A0A545TQR8_9PROT|nr:hypothetical protein [Denitrobaculum tricleocarpae]TQV79572.1 hypothetical protein FKG95_12655 [Denitrobaculum tricleocarpae]